VEGRSGIGTIGWAADMQMLVNQEARTILGAFQTTNQGCLSLESAMRAATTQLDNRRRRLGLRFRSLPEGDRAKAMTPSAQPLPEHRRRPPAGPTVPGGWRSTRTPRQWS